MKPRFLLTAAATVGLALFAVTGVSASSTTTTKYAPAVQGTNLALVMGADTVTGGGTPAPNATCAVQNLFEQGQLVVFRFWGNDTRLSGQALTQTNVKWARVYIAGLPAPGYLALTYESHTTLTPPVSYWEVPWSSTGYPLGTVSWYIQVKTKAAKSANGVTLLPSITRKFSQANFPIPSQLTITADS